MSESKPWDLVDKILVAIIVVIQILTVIVWMVLR